MRPTDVPEPTLAATPVYEVVDMVAWSGTGNTLRVAERIAESPGDIGGPGLGHLQVPDQLPVDRGPYRRYRGPNPTSQG
jgi:hypothetical protein